MCKYKLYGHINYIYISTNDRKSVITTKYVHTYILGMYVGTRIKLLYNYYTKKIRFIDFAYII